MHLVKELLKGKELGKEIIIKGWVKTHQEHGNISFIHLNDGSTFKNLQIIYKKPLENISVGSAIEAKGELKESKGEQPFELLASEIKVLAKSENFPIQKKEHSFEFLREVAHLRHRTSVFAAVNTIRNELFQSTHEFFRNENFYWIQSPILTSNSCEGGASVFEVTGSEEFFKKKALMSVSGQFHAEALSLGMGKVYTFGPTFRAEKSNSSNHLAEFWMIEPEMAFCDLEGNMECMERYIKYVISAVLQKNRDELEFLQEKLQEGLVKKLENLVAEKFEKLEYRKAIELLQKDGYQASFGDDLNSEQEKHITEVFNKPVFVFNYPKKIKAFYMKEIDGEVVSSVDLLVPGVGELIGGSARESSLELLKQKAKELNIPVDGIEWYTELRNYGYHSSAGFGCGFERLILYATGLKNIRDAIAYPRSYGHLDH